MFINLLGVSFKQCLFEFDATQSAFSSLQSSIPDSANEVKHYQESTMNYCKALEGYHALFWQRLHVPFTKTNAIDHEGFLWKKGSGFTKSWRKRYFVCHDGYLSYYHGAEDSDRPQGVLHLLTTCVKPIKDTDRRFTFTIISQTKVYTLQALTEWDMNEWMAVIQNNIQYLLDHNDTEQKNPRKSSSDQEVQEIQKREGNVICADCGLEDPSWCCINWGACICIHCSGVHRSLTTSVSKVRSLTLDKLDRFTVKLVSELGNIKANSILEGSAASDKKITKDCSKETREAYIRDKYVKCAFVDDDNSEIDMETAIYNNDLMGVYKNLCLARKRGITPKNGTYTWLHLAASVGHPIITLLIAYNTNPINVLDKGGWSPLSYAAFYGNDEAAEALLNVGADPCASKDAHPYYVARAGQNHSLAAMFLPYWSGSSSIQPEQLTPPVAIKLERKESDLSGTMRCATLNILGKLQQQK